MLRKEGISGRGKKNHERGFKASKRERGKREGEILEDGKVAAVLPRPTAVSGRGHASGKRARRRRRWDEEGQNAWEK